jgi:uncharacterized protein (DUF488 family)
MVWTIGHGGLSKEKFLELLKKHKIEILVDVRRFPRSRLEHFCREEMDKWLSENGIAYFWLGEELGGYRREGYEKYMKTNNFKEGIRRLLEIAEKHRTCMMCLETDPKYCHRRFIASYLRKRRVKVIHIVKPRRSY